MAIMPFVNGEERISYFHTQNESIQRGCYLHLCPAFAPPNPSCGIAMNKTEDFSKNFNYNVTKVSFFAFRRGFPGIINITLRDIAGNAYAYNDTYDGNTVVDSCDFTLACVGDRLNITMTPIRPIYPNTTYTFVVYSHGGISNEFEIMTDWYYTDPNPNFCASGSGSTKIMYDVWGEPIAPIDAPIVNIFFPIPDLKISNASEVTLSYFANSTDLQACWFTLDSGLTNTTIPGCTNTTFNAYSEVYANYLLRVYANDSFGQTGYAEVYFNTGMAQVCLDNKGIIDLILPFVPFIIVVGLAIMIMGLWSGRMNENGAVQIVVALVGFVILLGVAMVILLQGGGC